MSPPTTLNGRPTSNNGPKMAQTIENGAFAPDHPPVETTGRGLLTLDNAGPLQMGFWVPNSVYATANFLAPLRNEVARLQDSNQMMSLHPVVAYFKHWVTSHTVYRMLVYMMIEQANVYLATHGDSCRDEIKRGGNNLWISHYGEFFSVLSAIIQTSPEFNDTVLVGCPMWGFLAVGACTQAGSALFHDATFNGQFRKVLDAWNAYLKSPQSLDKLDTNDPEKPGSWISKDAFEAGVWQDIQYDPKKDAYGFSSWNCFFTRPFVSGARPFGGDATEAVNVGCETTPWAYVPRADENSNFWIKDKSYSLMDLFGSREDVASLFVGGPVYQGFLAAVHYHRWHSPVDGQLVRSWVEPGTYFAQKPHQGTPAIPDDGMESQDYFGHVATRAIFIFKHKRCGYVAMICIGMGEVSTCHIEQDWRMQPGQAPKTITRGTEIGHFEFGGSTHISVFQKDKVALADWARSAPPDYPVRMGTVIATALGSA